MKNFLLFFARKKTPQELVNTASTAASLPLDVDVPIYPPADAGVPVVDIEQVLSGQNEMLGRIKLQAAAPAEEWSRLYLSPILEVAKYIHLLPASQTDTHVGAGGLFRLAVELAFYTRQLADSQIFSREGVERRRMLEPRWKYAAFLAGLISELYRPLTQCIVVNEAGAEWPRYQIGLYEWLKATHCKRYYVTWIPISQRAHTVERATANYVVAKVVSPAALQFLADGSSAIPSALFSLLGADRFDDSVLAKLVRQAREQIIETDRATQPAQYGHYKVGHHLEPHLLDLMRNLVATGVWKINLEKSRLWFAQDGLYLVWWKAATEIIQLAKQRNLGGMPTEPATLLEALVKASVFEQAFDGPIFLICPPGASKPIEAVRLVNPSALLGLSEHERLAFKLVGESKHSHSTPLKPIESKKIDPIDLKPTPQMILPLDGEDQTDKKNQNIPTKINTPIPQSDYPSILNEWLKAVQEDLTNNVGGIHMTPLGVVISLEKVQDYGIESTKIIELLAEYNLLEPDPEKPARKIRSVEIKGMKPFRGIVLNSKFSEQGEESAAAL